MFCKPLFLSPQLTTLSLKVCILYYGGMLVTRGIVSSGVLVAFILYDIQFASAVEVSPACDKREIFCFVFLKNNNKDPLSPCYSVNHALLPRGEEGNRWLWEDLWISGSETASSSGGHIGPWRTWGTRSVQKCYFFLPWQERRKQSCAQGMFFLMSIHIVSCFQHTWLSINPSYSSFYQDVSLEIKPGKITALVGLNKSGKSTCVKLLERFYQPQAGEILLDGQRLQSYETLYLHEKVGG